MKCREDEYRTEMQTRKLCAYYMKKYGCDELCDIVFDWFDGQIDIGNFLGIHYRDLYRKDTNLDELFRAAAQR